MIKSILKLIPAKKVYAHCDIPCGIYDPTPAQIAAHTVIRMTKLIQESEPTDVHKITRLTMVKEQHAEILKHEVTVLWADYFKPEMIEKYPDLHNMVFETLKLASKGKQTVDLDNANKLLESVQKIAEIFYQTKNLEVMRIPSGYPTEGEIVTHK